MPIFLRRGAIIPRQEAMQYVDERPNTNISLLIYPSEHSVYEMYEDDGKSLDYQKGVYAVTKMESRLAQNEWILNITTPKGDYKPVSHYYSVSVYLDKKPKLVTVAGKFVDGWKTTRSCAYLPSMQARAIWKWLSRCKIKTFGVEYFAMKHMALTSPTTLTSSFAFIKILLCIKTDSSYRLPPCLQVRWQWLRALTRL